MRSLVLGPLIFEERCQVKNPKKSGLSKGSIAQHPTLIWPHQKVSALNYSKVELFTNICLWLVSLITL